MSGSNQTPMQLDDNLVNGHTYTFQFKCANWFCLSDISSTIQDDCVAQAPSFMTSIGVTSPPTTSLYNVQFTYEGDNSDVVSDVANSIVAAVKAVSDDNLTFNGAVAATAAAITVTPAQAGSIIAQKATDAANTVIADVGSIGKTAVGQAGGLVNTAVEGLIPLLIIVVLIILYVLPSLSKSVKGSGLTLS